MARISNGIMGAFSGKVGPVVGSTWKGIPYMKARYKKRTKRVSKKELANREKFAMSQSWLRPLLDFVREGFKGYSPTSEGFVAAKSWLLKNSFEGVAPGIKINPALVKVSHGDLPLSSNIAVSKLSKDVLEFTWDSDDVQGGSQYDQVMILAYDIKNEDASFKTTGQFRDAGSDTLMVSGEKGRVYHLYLAFNAADRKRQSHSVYLGEWKF